MTDDVLAEIERALAADRADAPRVERRRDRAGSHVYAPAGDHAAERSTVMHASDAAADLYVLAREHMAALVALARR